jgi:hypothetical protein
MQNRAGYLLFVSSELDGDDGIKGLTRIMGHLGTRGFQSLDALLTF